MPTVLNERGFRFMIYVEDHPPAHVYVYCQGRKVVVEFENDINIRNNLGMNQNDIARICRIVEKEQNLFLAEWKKIHE